MSAISGKDSKVHIWISSSIAIAPISSSVESDLSSENTGFSACSGMSPSSLLLKAEEATAARLLLSFDSTVGEGLVFSLWT
jgi:hypothetical protein